MTVRAEINRQDLERVSAPYRGRHSAEQGCLSGNSAGRTAKRLPDSIGCENREQFSIFMPETTSNSTAPICEQRVRINAAYRRSASYHAEQRNRTAAYVTR